MEQQEFDDLIARLDQAAATSQEEATDNGPLAVAIIGQEGHGRRTTFAAMREAMEARQVAISPVAPADAGLHESCQAIDCDFGDKSFRFILCPISPDDAPHAIAALSQAAIVIVVIDATAGITDEVGDLLNTARTVEVNRVLFYVNKCDLVEDDAILDQYEQELVQLTEAHSFDKPIIIMGCALGVVEDFRNAKALEEGPAKEKLLAELAEEDTSITGLIESVNYAAFAIASGKAVQATSDLKDKVNQMLGDSPEEQEAADALNQLLSSLESLNPGAAEN